ncbi:MAG: hypothetical protein ACOVMG_01905 [Flavobacterium sp.]
MKKIVSLVVVLILMLNVSCDKCEEGDRATPASFFVAIVDATTDENVFENETFLPTQIVIKDLDDKLIPFRFIPNSNLIQIFPNTQNLVDNTIKLKLNNPTTLITEEIIITNDLSATQEECYTTYKVENVQVPNNTFNIVDGIYVIKI